MSKIKDTIEDKQLQDNIELDARYQREVANNKQDKTICNLENTKKSTD